jgi:hypothetical protein
LVADVLIHLKKPSDGSATQAAPRESPTVRIVDFSVVSSLSHSAATGLNGDQQIPAGYAARSKERSKFKKYTDFYIIPDKQLVPAVIETHGGFGHDFLRLLDELYDPGPSATKAAVSAAGAKKAHFIRVMSVCVQTGNFLPILASYNPADKRVHGKDGLKKKRTLGNAGSGGTGTGSAPTASGSGPGAPAAALSITSPASLAPPAQHPHSDPPVAALPSVGPQAGGPSALPLPPSAGPLTVTGGGSV